VKRLSSIGLAAGLAFSLSAVANASPMLVGTTTNPTGINGLIVDGTTYNVTFSLTTLNSFTYSSKLSVDANAALVDALNALSVTGLDNAAPLSGFVLDVDNSFSLFNSSGCLLVGFCWVQAFGANFTNFGYQDGDDFHLYFLEAADFTAAHPTGVPEPFTLSLFGVGLLGAAAMRKWKSVKAA
jgi:hypothetical protein